MDSNGTPYVMPVTPAYGNGGGFGDGFGNGWWIILLFLFAGGGFGWGNGFGGGGNAAGFVNADVQRGFDQSAMMAGISGIQTTLASGFSDMQNTINATQMADMNRSFDAQTSVLQGFNSLQGQLAQCCCDNRLATVQTQTVVQTEGAATRNAIQTGVQMILDKMCQDKIDAKNEKIVELNNRINSLEANNYIQNALTAQTQFILNRYPVPVPDAAAI